MSLAIRRTAPLTTLLLAALAHAQTPVFINEIHYENVGGDLNESVEIAGPAGTNLTNWAVVLYNGSNGQVYGTLILSGSIPNQCGGYGTVAVAAVAMQNGAPDGLALLDDTGSVRQFLSYEGTFVATNGAANLLLSTAIPMSESDATPVGQSLQLSGSGTDYEDFTWASAATATAGACNGNQTFCAAATSSTFGSGNTHAVHGAGTLSTLQLPILGSTAELRFNYASPDPDNIVVLLGLARFGSPVILGDLPIHIDPAAPFVSVPFPAPNAMGANLPISIGNVQALCTGVPVFLQAFLLDATSPGTALNLLGTNGVEWVLGGV